MATRGWENATPSDVRGAGKPKPSKYRNVKVVIGTQTFDSKREANYWAGLKAREHLGEIRELRHHVGLPLLAPDRLHGEGLHVIVAYYECDFYYEDVATGDPHVVDAKGVRTALYKLKKKWLELQDGIIVEEV